MLLNLLQQLVTWITGNPYKIGENYMLRTVTFHFTGKLTGVFPNELVFDNVAWIADDGRFADAVATGTFNEVEPYPESAQVIIGRGSLIDAVPITFPLPRTQK